MDPSDYGGGRPGSSNSISLNNFRERADQATIQQALRYNYSKQGQSTSDAKHHQNSHSPFLQPQNKSQNYSSSNMNSLKGVDNLGNMQSHSLFSRQNLPQNLQQNISRLRTNSPLARATSPTIPLSLSGLSSSGYNTGSNNNNLNFLAANGGGNRISSNNGINTSLNNTFGSVGGIGNAGNMGNFNMLNGYLERDQIQRELDRKSTATTTTSSSRGGERERDRERESKRDREINLDQTDFPTLSAATGGINGLDLGSIGMNSLSANNVNWGNLAQEGNAINSNRGFLGISNSNNYERINGLIGAMKQNDFHIDSEDFPALPNPSQIQNDNEDDNADFVEDSRNSELLNNLDLNSVNSKERSETSRRAPSKTSLNGGENLIENLSADGNKGAANVGDSTQRGINKGISKMSKIGIALEKMELPVISVGNESTERIARRQDLNSVITDPNADSQRKDEVTKRKEGHDAKQWLQARENDPNRFGILGLMRVINEEKRQSMMRREKLKNNPNANLSSIRKTGSLFESNLLELGCDISSLGLDFNLPISSPNYNPSEKELGDQREAQSQFSENPIYRSPGFRSPFLNIDFDSFLKQRQGQHDTSVGSNLPSNGRVIVRRNEPEVELQIPECYLKTSPNFRNLMLGLNIKYLRGLSAKANSAHASKLIDILESKLQNKRKQFSKYAVDTLFYVFYCFPRDILQVLATQELYNRGWRFHGEAKIWFVKVKSLTNINNLIKDEKDGQNEIESWQYFDHRLWEKKLLNQKLPAKEEGMFISQEDVSSLLNHLFTSSTDHGEGDDKLKTNISEESK